MSDLHRLHFVVAPAVVRQCNPRSVVAGACGDAQKRYVFEAGEGCGIEIIQLDKGIRFTKGPDDEVVPPLRQSWQEIGQRVGNLPCALLGTESALVAVDIEEGDIDAICARAAEGVEHVVGVRQVVHTMTALSVDTIE